MVLEFDSMFQKKELPQIIQLTLLLFFSFPVIQTASAQKNRVAITIDDIQQENFFSEEDYSTNLLDSIAKWKIPAAIFISEGRLFKGDVEKRFYNIEKWISHPLITVGSHTYSHLYYSDTTFEFYTADIEKGLAVSTPLASKYKKKIRHFRFPFNCLGKDSLQHHLMRNYFKEKNIRIAPFTIESEDWAYAYVYEYYLSKGDTLNARKTGERYVKQTMEMFAYFEQLSRIHYKRNVNHIYLSHDNLINEHYLGRIIEELKKCDYQLISYEQALKDKIYKSEDNYYKKWGISWLYRYNYQQLKTFFKSEPNDNIYQEYEELLNEKK